MYTLTAISICTLVQVSCRESENRNGNQITVSFENQVLRVTPLSLWCRTSAASRGINIRQRWLYQQRLVSKPRSKREKTGTCPQDQTDAQDLDEAEALGRRIITFQPILAIIKREDKYTAY